MISARASAAVAFAGLIASAACQAEERPRYRDDDGHFSMIALDGWTQAHERDAIVFYGPEAEGLSATSIAIRSVPREGDWVAERTPGRTTEATKTAVQGLPGAELHGQISIAQDAMTGMQFELTFAPPRAEGTRYDRTHVVLVGDRVFHILHTAPEGTLGETVRLFEQVVDSFREEA